MDRIHETEQSRSRLRTERKGGREYSRRSVQGYLFVMDVREGSGPQWDKVTAWVDEDGMRERERERENLRIPQL